jgi:hypothetical protein
VTGIGLVGVVAPAQAAVKSNRPAVVSVSAVPSGQSATITYTINRTNKQVASQTCTLDGASTPCDIAPDSATTKPTVTTTYSVSVGPLENGSHTFAVTFRLGDGGSGSGSATFAISYTPPNQPPVAVDDSYSTGYGTQLHVTDPGVFANDSDPDNDTLFYYVAVAASNGTVTLSIRGGFRYTPNSGFSGVDSFTYQASDGRGGTSNWATVRITVGAPTQQQRCAELGGVYTESFIGIQCTFPALPLGGDSAVRAQFAATCAAVNQIGNGQMFDGAIRNSYVDCFRQAWLDGFTACKELGGGDWNDITSCTWVRPLEAPAEAETRLDPACDALGGVGTMQRGTTLTSGVVVDVYLCSPPAG